MLPQGPENCPDTSCGSGPWVFWNSWQKFSFITSDAHVTSVPGGVFIVLTKGAKRGWDSRAGEGEAGVAGLGGGWLEVGSKPSMKAPALSVPQVGSRRKPRAGDGDIGPPVPSPSVSLPGIKPFLLVTLSEPSLR